jgi:hypothetical protein
VDECFKKVSSLRKTPEFFSHSGESESTTTILTQNQGKFQSVSPVGWIIYKNLQDIV